MHENEKWTCTYEVTKMSFLNAMAERRSIVSEFDYKPNEANL